MKLKALALDYDGTISEGGGLSSEIKAAIARARQDGLKVLVVTGRILGELRRVAGDLSFLDAIVAENGAVVAFPASGRSSVHAVAASTALCAELTMRGVKIDVGEVVIEADASAANIAVESIRKLEQPLAVHFNRNRMMILPQGVSKATGLAIALDALRLSPHNALAIGDAENDHELLRAAEIGVAVEWGSSALKAMADEILNGSGPAAVSSYIDALVARLSDHPGLRIRRPRRRVVLGTADEGELISLGVSGRNVLVTGDPRSGKSWVAGLICEQIILHGYSVCVIDPEGDYSSLESLPRVIVVGGDEPPPKPHELLRLLRHPDRSIVLDLCQLPHREKLAYLLETLPQITSMRRHIGLPHRLLIDEAHYFLRDGDMEQLFDTDFGGCTAVTYQASRLLPEVLKKAGVMLVSRATDPREVETLVSATGATQKLEEWSQTLGDLSVGEVALLPGAEESPTRLRRIRLVQRMTPHVRHRTKYLDVPVASQRSFVFTHGGRPTGVRARTMAEFVEIIGRSAPATLDGHLQREDFSRWVRNVFGDYQLATTLHQVETDYRLSRIADINDAIVQAVRLRYEMGEAPRAIAPC